MLIAYKVLNVHKLVIIILVNKIPFKLVSILQVGVQLELYILNVTCDKRQYYVDLTIN